LAGGVPFRPNPLTLSLRGKGKIWRGSHLSASERGKTPANPQPTGVGKGGGGGCAPRILKEGESSQLLPPRHGWDPKRWQALSPRGWARGMEGAQAPSQGAWGMCPQNFHRRGKQLTFTTPPRVGPKVLANPQPTGVGKMGVQGAQAPWQGVWGMCPHKTIKGGE
jgi:hypothetical protein